MGDPRELGSQHGAAPFAEAADQLLVFRLDGQRYALDAPLVQRVVRAVEITLLPTAPAIILGIIKVGGELIPVVDNRRRFR